MAVVVALGCCSDGTNPVKAKREAYRLIEFGSEDYKLLYDNVHQLVLPGLVFDVSRIPRLHRDDDSPPQPRSIVVGDADWIHGCKSGWLDCIIEFNGSAYDLFKSKAYLPLHTDRATLAEGHESAYALCRRELIALCGKRGDREIRNDLLAIVERILPPAR